MEIISDNIESSNVALGPEEADGMIAALIGKGGKTQGMINLRVKVRLG